MKPVEFAAKHLSPYRVQGSEIIPAYCPYCQGGPSKDANTFALNEDTLLYNCKRGTCGASGAYRHLLRDYGEIEERNFDSWATKRVEKTCSMVKVDTQDPGTKVLKYIKLRGIGEDVVKHWQVGEVGGAIAFPYYENGELVLMKYRRPKKHDGKGPKAWREAGGKAVFWGMDRCRPDEPLTIVEGEFDAMALTECGIRNVTSVPSGAEDLTCIDNCWDWLQQFKKIIIWPDADTPGQEMCRKLIAKLGAWRCAVVNSKHKDPNTVLYKEGPEAVLEEYQSAKDIPIAGLLRLADVQSYDHESVSRVKSSITGLNEIIGGYMGGQLTVVTGINGSGKSTFLGQELLTAIDQGYAVCAYSGELPAALFRHWVDLQAAGRNNLESRFDTVRNDKVYYVKSAVKQQIRDWYRDKFFLYDSFGGASDEALLKVFEYAAMRYDCKIFLIDNLMATAMESSERDFFRKQADFVKQVKGFANAHDVHVVLVAHPRKSEGRLTKMDVAGAGEITNWADNVYGTHRVAKNESSEYQTIIDLFKSRWTGMQEENVGLLFDEQSKRFYTYRDEDCKDYQYGWNRGEDLQCEIV